MALDEFQYFNRKPLFDFCSLLQAEVDKLSARAESVKGGLIVLGSLHAESQPQGAHRALLHFRQFLAQLAHGAATPGIGYSLPP